MNVHRPSDQSRDRQGAPRGIRCDSGLPSARGCVFSNSNGSPASSFARRSLTVAALMGPRRRGAFTVVELLVSMAILTATIIAVAAVFSISSDAATRTEAHAEILEASSAFQQTVSDELSHMAGGLLIIESPPPTLVRSEIHGGPKLFRLRHDRLVFIASRGSEGEYQSFTDPTRGDPTVDPTKAPVGSPNALIYYGPGIPVIGDGTATGLRRAFDDESIGLTAEEWVFAHRAILLMLDPPNPAIPGWGPPDMAAFEGGILTIAPDNVIYEARMDALTSSAMTDATPSKLVERLLGIPIDTPTPRLSDLWSPNLTPVTASVSNSTYADHYTRSGFTFQPRMVDFRIEWTDGGSIDQLGADDTANTGDENFGTRWFGLAPYRSEVPDLSDPDTVKYQARMRSVPDADNPSNPNADNLDNSDIGPLSIWPSIEWSPNGVTADAQARYRAAWRANPLSPSDTWQYRPKALRFTYRLYDATNRLKLDSHVDFNEDGVPDPDPADNTKQFVVTRYGQEFSIVVPIP